MEQRLDAGEAVPPREVALSGGGHRATLLSLGALLYLVDTGLNRSVRTVASVSGGSITNAFVAQECDFRAVDPDEFYRVAGALAGSIVRSGLIGASRVSRLIYIAFGLATLGLLAATLSGALADLRTAMVILGLWILWLGLLLLRGVVLDRLMGRLLFNRGRGGSATHLRDVKSTCVHVFTATDLILGRPFYFTNLAGGRVFGFGGVSPRFGEDPFGGWGDAASIRLQTAVRASAALPGGFPPKRLRYALDYQQRDLVFGSRGVAYLADGGVWNNLATQWWSREHGPKESPAGQIGDGIDPAHFAARPPNLLVVNASAPPGPLSRTWRFRVPGLAEAVAFIRSVDVLYRNTITPRLEAANMRRAGLFGSQVIATIGDRPGRLAEEVMARYSAELEVTDWELIPDALFDEMSARHERVGQLVDHWETFLIGLPQNQEAVEAADLSITVGTNLSRIPIETATALMMHGYMLAMEASFFAQDGPLISPPSLHHLREVILGTGRAEGARR